MKLLVEQKEDVMWITLNRPKNHNAIDNEMMNTLEKLIKEIRRADWIKCVVITGNGKSFCAGGDLEEFHGLKTERAAYEVLERMGRVLYDIMTLPVPTVALINGAAIGGGCELAAACDYRFASKDAVIGFIQGNLGIITGWGGAAILHEKVCYYQAIIMLCSAHRFSAEKASEYGFVNEIFLGDVMKSCHKWLDNMIVPNIKVQKAYKAVAIRKWEESNLRERMKEEITECARLWESEEHSQAIAAFLKK
ncbi:enoyl-CoA hydratase/isomerase family protein [Bacillus bingmayongensis]|uniref:enoyl-CoA hydratase/isomerase family protein n=1 Tax=Bacillus bingmayongensis TaxID=1150157 RepID=UPI000315FA33|nr:enoyl-CoA hydratase/isomerase family protein [Bacillus bingmayongensis]